MSQDKKDTNPKDAVGSRKLTWSVIPWRALRGAALALLEGALKYGRHNYRPAGVRASVYFDANQRHMMAWWEGQDVDPFSKLCHIDKAIASLLVLRDSMLEGNWKDDRPPRVADGWIEEGSEIAARMIDECPEPKEMFTEVGRTDRKYPHVGYDPMLGGYYQTSEFDAAKRVALEVVNPPYEPDEEGGRN